MMFNTTRPPALVIIRSGNLKLDGTLSPDTETAVQTAVISAKAFRNTGLRVWYVLSDGRKTDGVRICDVIAQEVRSLDPDSFDIKVPPQGRCFETFSDRQSFVNEEIRACSTTTFRYVGA